MEVYIQDKNEIDWRDNAEEALDYGAQIIKLILDVGRKYLYQLTA